MESFKGIKICFLADKHDLFDDRIYWKMAVPMQKRGAEVHYFLIGQADEEGTTAENINYRIWKVKTFSENLFVNYVLKRLNPNSNYHKMLKKCEDLKADIYHFHDLWINRIGRQLKALPHDPVVFYDAREPYAEDYRSLSNSGRISRAMIDAFAQWVDRWEKKKAGFYDLVIANEPKVRKSFAKAIGDDKAVVIYNFTDSAMFDSVQTNTTTFEGSHKRYDLLYCGLLTEKRGAWNILETVREARERMPQIKVLLLGKIDPPGLRQEILTFIRRYELEECIEIRPQVPYQEVGKFYRQSKLGLLLWQHFPNLEIKMPIKLLEYMAFGLPVVGSNFGHISDLITRESVGLTVDPENVEEVVEAIFTLLENKEAYSKMRENGLEATRKEYNWQKELDRLCEYYKNALNER